MSATASEGAASGELSAQQVIEMIAAGSYPCEVVQTLARGFLPLPQEELLPVLAYLALGDDSETAAMAQASLADMPSRIVLDFAMNANAAPEHLTRLMYATRDNLIAEALIRNRAVPDEAIVQLAAVTAEPALQEVIVINQSRILRAPQILDALLTNPQLAPDARRRALETREEFFEKKARLQQEAEAAALLLPEPEEEPEPENLSFDAIADLLEKAVAEGEAVQPLAILEGEKEDERKFSAWAKLQVMGVADRVKIAFKGDRMTRMFLVRDRNRLICTSVMRNPRMTESEIELIAGMRNVDEEVLRLIGMNREWLSKYPIMIALCRNPKAPIGVVLPLLNRLALRDLKGLKDDKGVSQAVRDSSRRSYIARTKKS
jgi:hypothetical protein